MQEILTGGPTGPGSPLSPYRQTQEKKRIRWNQIYSRLIKQMQKASSHTANKMRIYACLAKM